MKQDLWKIFTEAPNWVKGVVGLIATISGFILSFRNDPYLTIVIFVTVALVAIIGISIVVIFSKRVSLIEGGGERYKYPQYRALAKVLLVLVPVMMLFAFIFMPTRLFVTQAMVGTWTPTPTVTPTPKPPQTANSTTHYYNVAIPSCESFIALRPSDRFIIRLRWGAKTQELAEQGADFVKYTLAIDGAAVEEFNNFQDSYRKPAVLEVEPLCDGDPSEAWWVYWDFPMSTYDVPYKYMSSSLLDASLETLSGIDNGWNVLPVGTKLEFKMDIFVAEATPTAP